MCLVLLQRFLGSSFFSPPVTYHYPLFLSRCLFISGYCQNKSIQSKRCIIYCNQYLSFSLSNLQCENYWNHFLRFECKKHVYIYSIVRDFALFFIFWSKQLNFIQIFKARSYTELGQWLEFKGLVVYHQIFQGILRFSRPFKGLVNCKQVILPGHSSTTSHHWCHHRHHFQPPIPTSANETDAL